MKTPHLAVSAIALILLTAASCPQAPLFPDEYGMFPKSDPAAWAPHDRYEAMRIPADNPFTYEKAYLGWRLWHEKRLSGDGKLACYSCHVNEKGLSDGLATGKGAFDKPLTRNAPTMWNVGYLAEWYWDGRAKTLEAQALAAWKGVNMGAAKPEEVCAKLNGHAVYSRMFEKAFGGPATPESVTRALATYMRTIVGRDTAYDRWQRGNQQAATDAARRGFEVFNRAKCTNCHSGVFFTDQQYHNVGIGMDAKEPDLGRFAVTKQDKDKGAFKTPTLRDVARSGPYFHNGSAATLEDAVRVMVGGGLDNPWLDRVNLQKVALSDAEIRDLVEFLKALTEETPLPIPPEIQWAD